LRRAEERIIRSRSKTEGQQEEEEEEEEGGGSWETFFKRNDEEMPIVWAIRRRGSGSD